MSSLSRRALIPLSFFLLLSAGCYNTPVRHLASDVSLIKSGETTRANVLLYLGEPDERRAVSPTKEEWIYLEAERSTMQNMPLVGEAFDPNGYNQVKLTLEGNIVTACQYSTLNKEKQDQISSTRE